MAFGPDGMLYVNSGARTDGGEIGKPPKYYPGGEVDLTACLWRLDPKAETPKIEVIARGIRNAYGFAWDDQARLFAVSNGPDASEPEEMDFIEPGRHYGFPYQFGNKPAQAGTPYKHTPKAPEGLVFTPPVANLGPAGGGKPDAPCHTFDPHSSPAGMIWCGPDFPPLLRNSFLITRFGNLIDCPADTGFDLLSARTEQKPDGAWQTRVSTVLGPLGRPLDVLHTGAGHVLILEYTRPTNHKGKLGWLPGRILELAPAYK
jgi:glucose/arabinose dehydrogenase